MCYASGMRRIVSLVWIVWLASCVVAGQDTRELDPDQSDSGDVCAIEGRYGDGTCDLQCAFADSDCTAEHYERAAYVIAELDTFNAPLVAEDRADKFCRMAESPFVFFRGSNHLFWGDFAGDQRFLAFGGDDTRIWLQGDLHVYNYGSFDNDDGRVVYDLNDFDEVVLADYQWDVWRMAVSIVLSARDVGFSELEIAGFLDEFTEAYLDAIASYRGNDNELSMVFDKGAAFGRLDEFLIGVENEYSRKEMLRRWTDKNNGVRIFDLELEKLTGVDGAIDQAMRAAIASYAATTGGNIAEIPGYFDVKDIARRLYAGTGSLGVARYYVLIEGETDDPDDDRILDAKRQGEPSAYPYLSADEWAALSSAVSNHAERAVMGYRALLADADDHLGWLSLPESVGGGTFSVRERSPYKDALSVDTLDSTTRFEKLAEQWGTILATAHARSDKDYRGDIIAYSFDRNVDERTDTMHAEFRDLTRDVAQTYADQVMLDYQAFVADLDATLCDSP